ncbi:glycosyltransferase family 2 protein [Vibrio cholerae]|uniref:glycosyltransferase family 2 protein n=1 Tax=Vibrio cholerae TaxID=666 RepID=UPI0004E3842A|nr:glycosyltransferase family 2 protein [Vibrio cholerae]EGQ9391384.1 glycosyltransferase family 2 protein [Vibrio cholerae]EGR0539667.1 glycosyltransferase family 2 protein [Vibrio cholerae]EGR2312110.1 glycosyltransferase family 2 protein [Vibrio cholerae]EGR3989910.1 glycosyltransferase family 2 protein [Vibrio cholerae]EJL6449250.1 glycosyltransferase family 2 protein [Vibrio cholerae]
MNELSLVSIITPSYNCAKTVHKTIQSVQAQTYPHWEMIIVDDCSTDNSVEILNGYAKQDPRIRVIARKWNAGPAIARNVAIEESKGRFIAFLDSDDSWHPTKLEKQIQFMLDNNVSLSYTSYDKYDSEGKFLGAFIPPSKLSYQDLLKSNSIGCLTAIYDSSLIGKVYMPNIAKRQDMGLWLRILKKVDYAYGMPDILADYLAVQANSVSSNKLNAAKYQWRLYREVEKLDFITSTQCFIQYAFRGYRKSR